MGRVSVAHNAQSKRRSMTRKSAAEVADGARDAPELRVVRRADAAYKIGPDLQLRVHLLRGMRRPDGRHMSQLRRRAGAAAAPLPRARRGPPTMTEERREWNPRHRIVLSVAGSADVVRQRIRVSTGVRQRELPADLYQQPGGFETLRPAMLFVHGNGDAEKLKGILDWGQYVSWGEAVAVNGIVGVTF